MEINFTVSKTFIGGSVAGLPGVLLKNEELVQGTPLIGASSRVVTNQFLFALSGALADSAANVDLLTSRKWIDLAVIYATGKRAIITLEKDDAADKLFREVFAEWAKTSDAPNSGSIPGASSVLPKTTLAEDAGHGRTERILTIKEPSTLEDVLIKNGFTEQMIAAISGTLHNVFPSVTLPKGAHLRILLGPSRTSDTLIPYRLSIYIADQHAATVALTDRGQYVLGIAPSAIRFPDEGGKWMVLESATEDLSLLPASAPGKQSRGRPTN